MEEPITDRRRPPSTDFASASAPSWLRRQGGFRHSIADAADFQGELFLLGEAAEAVWEVSLGVVDQVMLEGMAANVIWLPARRVQHETIDITELSPANGKFIGKRIDPDGHINEYPLITWWRQSVAQVPATIPALAGYLREARERNICLVRGAPANIERRRTKRQRAHEKDRGDHGFLDEPSKLFWFDVDGAPMKWKADPEGGVRNVVAQLGEPWASTSFVWFSSSTHGLERDGKRWTGNVVDGVVRVRLGFITERALTADEAAAFTKIAQARVTFKLDPACVRVVQSNYIRRPHWDGHPDEDVLGDIPTIGYVRGEKEVAAVPDDLMHTARWAKAQGHNVDIADHDDAMAAVRGIGSDGSVRSHLKSAVMHLLDTNPAPDVTGFLDHSVAIVEQLQGMVERHHDEIVANLESFGRGWSDVLHYLPDNMIDWTHWLQDHPSALNEKTIKLTREERAKGEDAVTREDHLARVARIVESVRKGEAIASTDWWTAYVNEDKPQTVLLVAPTGSRKSTEVRAKAVLHVAERPDESVAVLMPRHRLGDEQIEMLRREHPNANFNAAVWRGRHAWNPDVGDGREERMCRRSEEAEELEKLMIGVEDHLCKRGRGDKAVTCPLYDVCAFQAQKQIVANVWFGAHELAVHEMPKAFGKVGWVIFDESPIDAFLFGVEINDKAELALDALRGRRPSSLDKDEAKALAQGRGALHRRLDRLTVPIDSHHGAPVPCRDLDMDGFGGLAGWDKSAERMRTLELEGKIDPDIWPNMSEEQVRQELKKAAGNGEVFGRARLWRLVEEALDAKYEGDKDKTMICGRIQVHSSDDKGRVIRMVGLRELAKGWDVKTLICDATGDAELLRPIWPQLEEAEPCGWEQLPRPKSVRVFQCVNRSISKWAVAVEGKNEKALARKIEGARRVYAAVLRRALEYGGQDVGVIVYKSTREWIEANCCVPEWLKLFHFGDVVGTNALEKVRALFVIGRPLASPDDIARIVEALFGEYVVKRKYVVRRKQGRIPTVVDAAGNNTARVDVHEHAHPMGQRLKRQITEAAIIQAAGRARAGLRGDDEPFDLHLWTDVPVPELGPVEKVLWSELEGGLDALMLATKGIWLESIPDAARAYEGLFTVDGLKSARKGSGGVLHIGNPIYRTPSLLSIRYQKAGQGKRLANALVLAGTDLAAARAWLEAKLGSRALCEVEGQEQASA